MGLQNRQQVIRRRKAWQSAMLEKNTWKVASLSRLTTTTTSLKTIHNNIHPWLQPSLGKRLQNRQQVIRRGKAWRHALGKNTWKVVSLSRLTTTMRIKNIHSWLQPSLGKSLQNRQQVIIRGKAWRRALGKNSWKVAGVSRLKTTTMSIKVTKKRACPSNTGAQYLRKCQTFQLSHSLHIRP